MVGGRTGLALLPGTRPEPRRWTGKTPDPSLRGVGGELAVIVDHWQRLLDEGSSCARRDPHVLRAPVVANATELMSGAHLGCPERLAEHLAAWGLSDRLPRVLSLLGDRDCRTRVVPSCGAVVGKAVSWIAHQERINRLLGQQRAEPGTST